MSKVPTAEVAATHYYLQNLNDERKRMALGLLSVGLDNGDITQGDILALLSNRSPPPAWAEAGARAEADDELEIDDNPMSSETDDGCWVSAWVWVDKPPQRCASCGCTIDADEGVAFNAKDEPVCSICDEEKRDDA